MAFARGTVPFGVFVGGLFTDTGVSSPILLNPRYVMYKLLFATFFLLSACSGGFPPVDEPDTQADECDGYTYDGIVYACDELDRCTEVDAAYLDACCECDELLCGPDPACPTTTTTTTEEPADTCMACHNGSAQNDYAGGGLTNPHPFSGAEQIRCVGCHGGDGTGAGKEGSHVPAPPQIGDRLQWATDAFAEFNRRTLTGIDKLEDYEVDGITYSAIDYLQFINPGDLRVVGDGRSCGMVGCHGGEHVDWVMRNPIATQVGFYSGTLFTTGVDNAIEAHEGLYDNTAGDYGFRAVSDPSWGGGSADVGRVGSLLEFPENAVYGDFSGIYGNAVYDSTQLPNYVWDVAEDASRTNQIKTGSPLEHLVEEAIAFGCGDCHLGSAGANNRYGDFRSSGCTACHMEYSADGRSRSTDPNVNKLEPANPDAIAPGERSHIEDHQIRNVAKILPDGSFLRGINDKACAGCHQGSNRTVLQYWGIRLDQNQDLHNGTQYPANPVNFADATGDIRLYNPAINNNTFNGRVAEQHIVFEDYDGDGRDDTPGDVHYEAGMGCIDCHGSRDVHGGQAGDATSGWITSREDQAVAIECISCHGGVDAPAITTPCEDYEGTAAICATDRNGNPLRNVTEINGEYWLTGRVDGQLHYVPQTVNVVVNNNDVHPITGAPLYSPLGSYAMGRADGSPLTGTGPIQSDPNSYTPGFSHTDGLECVACHASWSNNCVGCHLELTYDDDPADYFFSNTTGERVTVNLTNADFVYSNPVLMTLGVGSRSEITQQQPGMKMFFRYTDLNGIESEVFAFTDRNGNGNNPNIAGRGAFGALAHNKIMPHSVRGKVTTNDEGPRYCVSCHLTDNAIATYGAEYEVFRTHIANRDYDNLDFNLLQQHIGQNSGNQLDSPYWVHMVSGLGTGLFLFDEFGCPVNPLDNFAGREYCNNVAPADAWVANNADNVAYDLDKLVEATGISNASNSHPQLDGSPSPERAGSLQPGLAGPFGATILQQMTDPNVGLVLDSWIDADGQQQGDAADFIQ